MGSATRFFPEVVAQASGLATAGADAMDLSEIMHESAEVTSLAVEIQQLDSMAAGINNLHSVGESVQGDEGFSEQTFAVIASQASLITEGTGLDPVRANMQSFSSGDNLAQTNVVMLALTDTAKNIWNAIIKAIKDLFAKIQQWFAKMTNAAPNLIKKFEKLRDEARNKTSGMKDDDEITLSSSVVKALGNGKSPKVDRAVIPDIFDGLKEMAGSIAKAAKLTNENHAKVLTALKDVNVDSNKAVVDTLTSVSGVLDGNADDLFDGKPDTALNKKLGLPEHSLIVPLGLGNKGVIVKLPEDPAISLSLKKVIDSLKGSDTLGDGTLAVIAPLIEKALKLTKTTLTIGYVVPDIESAESQEIKAFPASAVVDMCTNSIEVLEKIKTFKEDHQKSSKATDKFTSEVLKAADKVENAKVDDSLSKAQTLTTKIIKGFADTVKQTAMLPPQAAEFILTTTNAVYTIGKQSLSAHK